MRTDRFSAAEVIAKIEYPKSDSRKQEDPHIRSYIETFISSSSSERLKKFFGEQYRWILLAK